MTNGELNSFKYEYLNLRIERMSNLVKQYGKWTRECDIDGVSITSQEIGGLQDFLKNEKNYMRPDQEEKFESLNKEFSQHFDRLKSCECKKL